MNITHISPWREPHWLFQIRFMTWILVFLFVACFAQPNLYEPFGSYSKGCFDVSFSPPSHSVFTSCIQINVTFSAPSVGSRSYLCSPFCHQCLLFHRFPIFSITSTRSPVGFFWLKDLINQTLKGTPVSYIYEGWTGGIAAYQFFKFFKGEIFVSACSCRLTFRVSPEICTCWQLQRANS